MKELMVLEVVSKIFRGLSTSIGKLVCGFVGINASSLYELSGYRISTQTLILEITGVNFNDFLIQAHVLQRNI